MRGNVCEFYDCIIYFIPHLKNKANGDSFPNNSINLDKKNVRTLSAPFSLEDLLRSERPEIRDRLASMPIPCGCGTDDHDKEKDEKKTNN